MSFSPLAGLLGGGSGGPQGAPQGAPSPAALAPQISVGGPSSDGPDNAAAQAALKRAEAAMQSFIAAEGDAGDKAIGSKILAQIHGIEAGRQKEREAAMGASPATKMIARQNGVSY